MPIRKRNILMPDSMWANLNRIAGRMAMNTGQKTSVSDVIRLACAAVIESEMELTQAEARGEKE